MEFNRAFDPFRALECAWKAFVRSPLPLLVGGVLLLLTTGDSDHGLGVVFREDRHDASWREIRPYVLPVLGVCGCFALALFLFSSWIFVGFANTVENVLRDGTGRVESVFQSKGRFGSMVLARLLKALIWLAVWVPILIAVFVVGVLTRGFSRHEGLALLLIPVFLLWIVPAVYVLVGVSLTPYAVALEGLEPVAAVQRSWSLVSGHRIMLILFKIVTGIVHAIGFCLCCFGVFLTGTLSLVAGADAYLALVRGAQRRSWWIERENRLPPPPIGWGTPSPPPPSPPPA